MAKLENLEKIDSLRKLRENILSLLKENGLESNTDVRVRTWGFSVIEDINAEVREIALEIFRAKLKKLLNKIEKEILEL